MNTLESRSIFKASFHFIWFDSSILLFHSPLTELIIDATITAMAAICSLHDFPVFIIAIETIGSQLFWLWLQYMYKSGRWWRFLKPTSTRCLEYCCYMQTLLSTGGMLWCVLRNDVSFFLTWIASWLMRRPGSNHTTHHTIDPTRLLKNFYKNDFYGSYTVLSTRYRTLIDRPTLARSRHTSLDRQQVLQN